jgi:hypothetical protein
MGENEKFAISGTMDSLETSVVDSRREGARQAGIAGRSP